MIKHTKSDKVIAYTVYWLLRRTPIQLTEFSESEYDIFVNERFACNLLLAECLLEKDINITDGDTVEAFDKYIDLLMKSSVIVSSCNVFLLFPIWMSLLSRRDPLE